MHMGLFISELDINIKAIDDSMYVYGLGCTPDASISVISVVLSGYRCVSLFIHSGLQLFYEDIALLIFIK